MSDDEYDWELEWELNQLMPPTKWGPIASYRNPISEAFKRAAGLTLKGKQISLSLIYLER